MIARIGFVALVAWGCALACTSGSGEDASEDVSRTVTGEADEPGTTESSADDAAEEPEPAPPRGEPSDDEEAPTPVDPIDEGGPDVVDAPEPPEPTAVPEPASEPVAPPPMEERDAGAPTTPEPMGEPPTGEQCWFEFLGDWVRCEETANGAESASFETLGECASDCLSDPSCSSFYDYNWIVEDLPCITHDGPCTPSTDVWYEEDGAREYRKVCGDEPPPDAIFEFPDEGGVRSGTDANCRFDYLGAYSACENANAGGEVAGESLSECLALCEENPDCTAVAEWWSNGPEGCALHLSSCDEPENQSDYGLRHFRKVCDE